MNSLNRKQTTNEQLPTCINMHRKQRILVDKQKVIEGKGKTRTCEYNNEE